jgi:subtilisin family serine protease
MKSPARLASVLAAAAAALALTSPALASGGSAGTAPTVDLSKDTELAGELLVKLRSGDAIGAVLQRYSLSLVSRFGARPIFRLKVIGAVRVKDVIAAMATDPDVMLAEPNPTNRSPEARGNNPWAIGTPGGFVAQWAPQAMHLAQAQARSRGAGVRVAVLDTGVDFNHPLLAGRLLPGRDFVDGDNDPSEVLGPRLGAYGHGTHVAGLIAMVAPDARIMPLRVLDTDGVGNAWVLAEALLYALDPDGNPDTDDGAHVINLSLGSMARTRLMDTIAQIAGCAPAVADDPVGDRSDPGYADDERRCARGNGAVVVAAAGNEASGSVKEYPAAEGAYGLLSVAASNPGNRVAAFSNFGTWVDMAAPGEGITSAIPGGLYGVWSGTSMAAPLTAGTAALVRSLDLKLAPKDVVQRLKRTAAVLCATNLRQVDAQAAVADTVPPSSSCR